MLGPLGEGIARGCELAGVSCPGGELAQVREMIRGEPGGPGFDLVATAIGTVALDRVLDGSGVCAGDVLLGIESSGLHSNGYTLLLSVGYSACHWCHVMERESFENADIALLMNQLFVNVKVDREERPDVDEVYMKAVQMLTGRGGWPMTVFLTPEGKPFYGGTYFPPTRSSRAAGSPAGPRRHRACLPRTTGRRRQGTAQLLAGVAALGAGHAGDVPSTRPSHDGRPKPSCATSTVPTGAR